MQCKLFATTICGDEARVWNRLEVIEGEREKEKYEEKKHRMRTITAQNQTNKQNRTITKQNPNDGNCYA